MTLFTRQIRSMIMRLMASQGLLGPLATVDATIGAKDKMITAPSNTCERNWVSVPWATFLNVPEAAWAKWLVLADFSRRPVPTTGLPYPRLSLRTLLSLFSDPRPPLDRLLSTLFPLKRPQPIPSLCSDGLGLPPASFPSVSSLPGMRPVFHVPGSLFKPS